MLRLLFSPIGLILISVLFMLTSISEIHTDRAFASRGKSATVDPPAQYKEIIHSKNGQPTSREEKADISFSTEDGRPVTLADRYLPPQVLQQFQNGEKVTILYLAEDPKSTRFPGEKIPTEIRDVVIPGIFLALGLIWYVVRRSSRGN
jgi:hypothetical protein